MNFHELGKDYLSDSEIKVLSEAYKKNKIPKKKLPSATHDVSAWSSS